MFINFYLDSVFWFSAHYVEGKTYDLHSVDMLIHEMRQKSKTLRNMQNDDFDCLIKNSLEFTFWEECVDYCDISTPDEVED